MQEILHPRYLKISKLLWINGPGSLPPQLRWSDPQ